MNTDKDNGLAVWCNNCQDFPDGYNLRSYSDGHAILRWASVVKQRWFHEIRD